MRIEPVDYIKRNKQLAINAKKNIAILIVLASLMFFFLKILFF